MDTEVSRNQSMATCPKKIFFSVGEPSGDLHASNLIIDLNQRFNAFGDQAKSSSKEVLEFTGFGGPKMAAAGCELLEDLTQHAVMFLAGVLSKIAKFRRLLRDAESVFKTGEIDLVVLIDYSGFNWHVAKRAKKYGIPVVFYGIPQMWAWAPWRVRKMRRNVDLGICKLPFEKKWLNDRGCEAEYVGHPFFDEMERQVVDSEVVDRFRSKLLPADKTDLITILPGSRVQEIRNTLPVFLNTARKILQRRPQTAFVISCLDDSQKQLATEIAQDVAPDLKIPIEGGQTPELIHLAKCCLACSGSVSLELMDREKPTVIYYRLPVHLYLLQKLMLRVRYITLVNLLWTESIERRGMKVFDPDAPDAETVPFPEYLSTRDKSTSMAQQLTGLLDDSKLYQSTVESLQQLKAQFGKSGASHRAVDILSERFLTDLSPDSPVESVMPQKVS